MSTALLVMTDGRPTVYEAIPSIMMNTFGEFDELWIHDDSGDPEHGDALLEAFPLFRLIRTPGRSGFGGAIRNAWSVLREHCDTEFIFHLEDDFTFNRYLPLWALEHILRSRPSVMNVALLRQPWSPQEVAAGGIIQMDPAAYEKHQFWVEHRKWFTTNPCMYRRSLIFDHPWPEGNTNTERLYSDYLLQDPEVRFAYFNGTDGLEPMVTHIGHQRIGTGY